MTSLRKPHFTYTRQQFALLVRDHTAIWQAGAEAPFSKTTVEIFANGETVDEVEVICFDVYLKKVKNFTLSKSNK